MHAFGVWLDLVKCAILTSKGSDVGSQGLVAVLALWR